MSYEKKYLKYKLKYFNLLKELKGGAPIHEAIEEGNLDKVITLLQNREDNDIKRIMSSVNADNETPIFLAIKINNPEIVKELLKYNPDFTIVDRNGIKPINWFLSQELKYTQSDAVATSYERDNYYKIKNYLNDIIYKSLSPSTIQSPGSSRFPAESSDMGKTFRFFGQEPSHVSKLDSVRNSLNNTEVLQDVKNKPIASSRAHSVVLLDLSKGIHSSTLTPYSSPYQIPTTQSPTVPSPTVPSPTTQSPTSQSPTVPSPTTQSPTTPSQKTSSINLGDLYDDLYE
jgi:hypothetical protein